MTDTTTDLLSFALDRLPIRLRAPMAAFLDLALAADAVADDPAMPADRRLAVIEALDARIDGREPATALDPQLAQKIDVFLASTRDASGAPRHARHVLQAMRLDCSKTRYRDWNELLAYCRYAAAPFGRFAIEIAGESAEAVAPAEALCCAAQLLDHLQDCGEDFRRLDRVYLAERWLREHSAPTGDLAAAQASPALRAVFIEACDAADRLLSAAALLPDRLRDRRLRMAAAAAVVLVRRWSQRCRETDLLAARPRLHAMDRFAARVAALRRWFG